MDNCRLCTSHYVYSMTGSSLWSDKFLKPLIYISVYQKWSCIGTRAQCDSRQDELDLSDESTDTADEGNVTNSECIMIV